MLKKDKYIKMATDMLLGNNVSNYYIASAKGSKWYKDGVVNKLQIAKYLYRNELVVECDYKFNDVITNTLNAIIAEYGVEFDKAVFREIMVDAIDRYLGVDNVPKYYLDNVLYPMVSFGVIDIGSKIITVK